MAMVVSLVTFSIGAFALLKLIAPAITAQQVERNPVFFVPVQLFAYLVTYAVLRIVVVSRSGEPFWTAIHWHMPRLDLRLFYVLLGVALALAVQWVSSFLPIPKTLPVQDYFRAPGFAYMMVAFGVLIAPLAEEVFFRGLAFPVLSRTMGRFSAIIVTGAAFSLMHRGQLAWAWAPLLILFAVGIVLTAIRARTNSVAAGWIVHVSYNGTLFLMLFYFSNGFRNLGS